MGRKLGQHFLFDPRILERIALAACPEPAEPLVVEIGPGPGALTRALLERAARVIAVELDPALASLLPSRAPGVEVIQNDVLETDLAQWGSCVVAGNLPYYISSPILEKTLTLGPLLKRAVFLVQREFAERVVAPPGSRDYGWLSVAVQLRCRAEKLFLVKPGAFKPPPQVDSAVLRLTPLPQPRVEDAEEFLKFASLCFRMKRKTLRNNLAAAYPHVPHWTERAEQLSIEDLAARWRELR